MKGRADRRAGRTGRIAAGLLGLAGLVAPPPAAGLDAAPPGTAAAPAGPPGPAAQAADAPEPPPAPPQAEPPPMVAAPPESTEPAPVSGALDEDRASVEQGLGTLIDDFDRFFGADRPLDVESPSSRFRLKLFERSGADKRFAMGFAVAASMQLPRLERWLGHARVVVIGEREPAGLPRPPVGYTDSGVEVAPPLPGVTDNTPPFLGRGRTQAELRFDLLRRHLLILDSGVGTSLVWPPVPFGRLRAHLRLLLGGGVSLRATQAAFVEFWGRGIGTASDLELARLLTPWLRLRWEGHGVFAQRTRGVEWSSLVGADWRVHPRTGLFGTAGCMGFGTPAPSVDVWRVATGVRQDIWHNWIFVGLEPEMYWPRLAGLARSRVWAVTVRLEVALESRLVAADRPP